MAKIPGPPIPMANPIPRIPKYQPATDRSLSWLPPDRNSLFPDGCPKKRGDLQFFGDLNSEGDDPNISTLKILGYPRFKQSNRHTNSKMSEL